MAMGRIIKKVPEEIKKQQNGEVQGVLEDLGNRPPQTGFKISITQFFDTLFPVATLVRIRELWL